MDTKSYLSRLPKEYVYRQYLRLCTNPKEYEKITRSKMIDAIYATYTPQGIIDICTERELRTLQKILASKKKQIDREEFYSFEYRHLNDKFLLFGYEIPDSIKANIQSALKQVDWKHKQETDKIRTFLIGFVRMMNSILIQPFLSLTSLYLEKTREEMQEFLAQDRLFHYEVCMEEAPFPLSEGPSLRLIYDDDYEYVDDVDQARKDRAIGGGVNFSIECCQSFYYSGNDMTDPDISKLYEYIKTSKSRFYILHHLHAALLYGYDLEIFLKQLQDYKIQDPKLEKLVKEAYPKMHFAALNGMTLEEYYDQLQENQKIDSFYQEIPCQGQSAHLSEKDVKLFYRMYFGLLNFTNQKYQIAPHAKFRYGQVPPRNMTEKIKEKFWQEKGTIIQEYCDQNPQHFSTRVLNQIQAFRYGFYDQFILVTYEKDYAVFVNENATYMVKGLSDNIDTLMPKEALPVPVTTALIPFQGRIVYDGLLETYEQIDVGPNLIKRLLNETLTRQKIYDLMPDTTH